MKIVFFALFALVLGGCLYPNECGLSRYVYDDKEVYYDSQGSYHENCPSRNVIDFKERGVK